MCMCVCLFVLVLHMDAFFMRDSFTGRYEVSNEEKNFKGPLLKEWRIEVLLYSDKTCHGVAVYN